METGDPLVSASWLMENLNAPDIRVLDATWIPPFLNTGRTGQQAYDEGHIPGAVFFDIDHICDQDTDLPHMMPDSVLFASRVRKLGIGDGHRVIIYDSNNFFASARAWWMLRVMGHSEVKVLDGGLAAWSAEGGELQDLPPVPVERHFTPRVRADLVKTSDQILGARDATVLDARPEGRFQGIAPEPRADLRSGHIPGSVNVPSDKLIAPDGKMKLAKELASLLPHESSSVICTCGSGVSAAVNALALARLGNYDAAIYDGSWSEWGAKDELPIATAAE